MWRISVLSLFPMVRNRPLDQSRQKISTTRKSIIIITNLTIRTLLQASTQVARYCDLFGDEDLNSFFRSKDLPIRTHHKPFRFSNCLMD